MTKTELIQALSTKHHKAQAQYAETVNEVLAEVSEQLARGESICLTGFGTFRIKDIAEVQIQDLRSGERRLIPAHRRVHFHAGDVLKRSVWNRRRGRPASNDTI